MNNNGNKPKLELQLNIPCRIKLMQDKALTGNSNFGTWYLYNVIAEDKDQPFFAPVQVQDFIENNQLKKGDELQVTKVLTKEGKRNVIDFDIQLLSKQPTQDSTNAKPSNGNGKPDDIKIMRECLIAAIELQKELGSVVDVNKVGLSLYISKTKNGNYQF